MDNAYRTVTLPDGRQLEYLVEGDPDGVPLVLHHGTPGSAVPFPRASEAAAARGLALVMCSRAGYGGSSPDEGRTVASVAADVAALLDSLDRTEFLSLGWSGGGPHSLACAALLPERCRAAATGAGVAPYDTGGELDFLAGMGPENVEEFGAALAGREALAPLLKREAAKLTGVTPEEVAEALGGLVSPVDKAYATGEVAGRMLASFTHGCANGTDGWADDDLAFTQHWGFDLQDITVPVSIWQGGQDRMVPFEHGQWLAAHVPGARAHLYDDEGHLSLWNKLDEVFDDLKERAGL
ncbi:alpha/beta fold hydrolase [Nocardioides mesophilus]|uniref:Alpha/beta hydrolase n=1 Tax=Nocardioides mesophilus TaxID=433659 RepID=A0A7G9R8Q5_9ACTN|nr:alpha/beta hydrolase [Nocardioides mesophilus]QNN51980.1 alpha/beta hydrolase [Nocardioides mesophilus]